MTDHSSSQDPPENSESPDARYQVAVRIRETGIRRWQAVSLLRPLVERALPHCLSCALYEDLSETGSILLLQEWESLESAQRHLRSGAFEAITRLTDPSVELSILESVSERS